MRSLRPTRAAGNYRFKIDDPPELVDADIFLQPRFHSLHRPAGRGGGYYFSYESVHAVAEGVAHFHRSGSGEYCSPLRGSFGGFWGSDRLAVEDYEHFVSAALAYLSDQGAERVTITLPPLSYAPDATALQYAVLSRLGLKVARWELTQHLTVSERPFRQCVHKEKRRRLNMAERDDVSAALMPVDRQEDVYQLLSSARAVSDIPLSMSWESLKQMSETFPSDVLFVGANATGGLVGGAIAIRVSSRVAYALYYGNHTTWKDRLPALKALEFLYDWCRDRGISVLDLGASSIEGNIDMGILQFKQSLGASVSLKFWLAGRL